MLSKENTLTLLGGLAAASVTGIGLAIGGPIGAAVMAGVGVNLSSNIIQNGAINLKQRWLSENGILNHDIQKALVRAFIKSLSSLESRYFESEQAKALKSSEKESIRDLFKELRERAQINLRESLERVPLDEEVWHYLVNVPDSNMHDVWDVMVGDKLLAVYGSEFRDFIRQNLLNEILFHFNEELKTDSKETNKAWRAFQRMLLEGIYADVKSVQTNQELISQDLRKLDVLTAQMDELKDVIDRRLPDELFQHELEDAIGKIHSKLQRIDDTTQRIDRTVGLMSKDVRAFLDKRKPEPPSQQALRELSQIRQNMIVAHSIRELKEAQYKVEEFLSKYPNYHEARLLKDEIRRALAYESVRAYPAAPAGAPPSQYAKRTLGCSVLALGLLALGLIILALYLLYRWFF
jgi:hypothetical protein